MSSLDGMIVIGPNGIGYNKVRKMFNARFDKFPSLEILPRNDDEAIRAVDFAVKNRMRLRVKSRGRSYEGFDAADGQLMISKVLMKGVKVDSVRKIAQVEAGEVMGDVNKALAKFDRFIPPSALATSMSGNICGGFSYLTRKYGLTIDSLAGVDMVVANNANQLPVLVHANATTNPELFWATQGGGLNVPGFITRLHYRLHPLVNVSTFLLKWTLNSSTNFNKLGQVLGVYQFWGSEVTRDLTSSFAITNTDARAIGMFVGSKEKLRRILQPLLDTQPDIVEIEPPTSIQNAFDRIITQDIWYQTMTMKDQLFFKNTGVFISRVFSSSEIEAIVEQFTVAPSGSFLMLNALGGAVGDRTTAESVYGHRNAKYAIEISNSWEQPVSNRAERIAWVNNLRRSIERTRVKEAYSGWVDLLLEDPDEQYYPTTLERLRRVNEKFDPLDLFGQPQTVQDC
ncbi:FAD-binding oxidoreductase [Mechercharimyces sp. CAU 1602]|uniref:FAD-binding oxidoreductase n=1 Tax=Mechercharimyces sp. CAU 1602 TaxID=2973933 RepID=UPI0021618EC7|nr:FAD-binding oxidoreductase [Mechercharimyces sp. CAU 1602]MCS1350089.1 FAD-binding oxidoreductase [Mechercharimyces sp. CAU 1602]